MFSWVIKAKRRSEDGGCPLEACCRQCLGLGGSQHMDLRSTFGRGGDGRELEGDMHELLAHLRSCASRARVAGSASAGEPHFIHTCISVGICVSSVCLSNLAPKNLLVNSEQKLH